MFRYGSFLWVYFLSFLISTFWFIAKCIERLKVGCKNQGNDANFNVSHSREDDQEVVSMMIPRDFSEEKRSSEFSFSFLYQQSKKDSLGNFSETDESAFVQSGYSASTRRYQFVSGKNVSEFVQKADAMSFTIREMFVGSAADGLICNDQNLDLGALPTNERVEEEGNNNSEGKVAEFYSENPSVGRIEEVNLEEESPTMQENFEIRQKDLNSIGNRSVSGEEINDFEDCHLEEEEEEEEDDGDITYDFQFCPRDEFPVPDSNQKSSESSGDDSCSNNNDNNLEFQPENYSDGFPNEILAAEAVDMFINTNTESIVTEDTEYMELEPDAKNITNTDEEMLPQNHESDCSEKFEKSSLGRQFWESKNSVDDEDEDDDEFDILLEHKQLVQQMKMEMKNSKIKSLPTIVEEEEDDDECETTKMVEDLTPLKIEEKFEYKDLMGEIHKFYKSYAEKMRKLDILNYQSLHAINIVQLKDTRVFVLSKKASLPFIKHFGLPTFGTGKGRKVFADPSLKSITEVQRDLELVYIGQVCLSWEILRWQYGKLKLLLEYEYDSRGHHHSYNVVAGEYQQLQVLMHRFLEEELIQGPRIKHYVESRCLCRSILQVPIIKDDFSNKKDRLVVGEKDAIPITKLAETIKDSMQVFFEFIRSDKDGTIGSFKGTQLRNPADLELLSNIKTRLKKKERKLRDIQRCCFAMLGFYPVPGTRPG